MPKVLPKSPFVNADLRQKLCETNVMLKVMLTFMPKATNVYEYRPWSTQDQLDKHTTE